MIARGIEQDVTINMNGDEIKVTPKLKERIKALDALARRYGLDKPSTELNEANNKLDEIIEELKNAAK